MLDKFRLRFLRKTLWLAILFGSLFMQSENLFACELMASGPQTSCCCDEDMSKGCLMGGGCEMADNNSVTSGGCCDVSTRLNIGLQNLTATDSQQNLQVALLDAPQPPPAPAALVHQLTLTAGISAASKIPTHSPLPPTHGPAIYSLTQRFRI